ATFLDHTFATARTDWPATYRNWMRESMKRAARNFRTAPCAPTMGRDAPTPTPAQIEALLLEDFLHPPWCLAVEWPEKISAWIPSGTLHLNLGITANEHHTIRLS
ncbi:MAG: hypothetical protein WCQ44_12235, partial [Opitutaceae bacterium]